MPLKNSGGYFFEKKNWWPLDGVKIKNKMWHIEDSVIYQQAQVSDLKEMCDALKKEKAEVEKKLGNIRGVGHYILGYLLHLD